MNNVWLKKNIYMGFGINGNFVYTLYINKSHYEEDKQNWSCITGDNLCTDRRQHLPRWFILPCTSKSSRRNCKQELLKQEKGNRLPQRIEKRVTELLPTEVKAWVCKRLGLFYVPQCMTTQIISIMFGLKIF